MKKINHKIFYYFILIFFSILNYLRINTFIFDEKVPTYLFNLINQLSKYGYPAVFPGYPLIDANLHQLNLFIVSKISTFINIEAQLSMKIFLTLTSSFLIFILLKIYKKNNISPITAFLILCINLFGTGIPFRKFNFPKDWYAYLNIFDYFASHSYNLIFCIFALIFYSSYNKSFKTKFYLYLLPIIIMPYLNITFYLIYLIGVFVFILLNLFKKEIDKKYLFFSLPILSLSYLLSLNTTTAINNSESYEKILLSLTIFNKEIILSYLKTSNIFVFVLFFVSLKYIKEILNSEFSFTYILFNISFLTPLIVYGKNIHIWDTYHKYILLTSFFSLFLSIFFVNKVSIRIFYTIVLFSAILSFLNLADQFTARVEYSFSPKIYSYEKESGLISFLNLEEEKYNLYYLNSLSKESEEIYLEIGSPTIVDILSKTSAYAPGYYFNYFLLSNEIEEKIEAYKTIKFNNEENFLKHYINFNNYLLVNSSLYSDIIEFFDLSFISYELTYRDSHYLLFKLIDY